MAHSHVIRTACNIGKSTHLRKFIESIANSNSELSTLYNQIPLPITTPDPDLPLIDPDAPAEFTRLVEGRRLGGRVFSQKRTMGRLVLHPILFYVEFPADSRQFYEIDANRLLAAMGYATRADHHTRHAVARTLDESFSTLPPVQLLTAARPA